jgi:hypothetical protein
MGDCTANPVWQPSIVGYNQANTDPQLTKWWQGDKDNGSINFANDLGKSFGSHANSYFCGIDFRETCTVPACSGTILCSYRQVLANLLLLDYEHNGDPAWPYQALASVVNVNVYLNNIYVSITSQTHSCEST